MEPNSRRQYAIVMAFGTHRKIARKLSGAGERPSVRTKRSPSRTPSANRAKVSVLCASCRLSAPAQYSAPHTAVTNVACVFSHASMFWLIATGNPAVRNTSEICWTLALTAPSISPSVVRCCRTSRYFTSRPSREPPSAGKTQEDPLAADRSDQLFGASGVIVQKEDRWNLTRAGEGWQDTGNLLATHRHHH
jgi:hypothetical protein